jgi:acetylornithine deacetylase
MHMALDTTEILQRLVGHPTVSRDSNLSLINWVRNFLSDFAIESHLVPDATGLKANLFASVGPDTEGGIVLSGHTDVVPVDDQPWSSDPFKLLATDRRLYGRGTSDMKGFIAAALSRFAAWSKVRLDCPVHLMLSYDEEVGCQGAPLMIAAAQSRIPKPAAVIVGEPTGMRLATQHKGLCWLRTRVTGITAHSSLTHQGMSAVMLAAELIGALEQISRKRAAGGSPRAGFEPPYTTLSVNRIEGGTAINILAGSCEFGWDIRALPGETPQLIIEDLASFGDRRLRELLEEGKVCNIETSLLAEAPPLRAEDASVAEEIVRAAANEMGESVCVPFGTEGGLFQRAGWSTVVCGPGSIEQAHKPDEFIERGQLAACEEFLDRLIRRQHA